MWKNYSIQHPASNTIPSLIWRCFCNQQTNMHSRHCLACDWKDLTVAGRAERELVESEVTKEGLRWGWGQSVHSLASYNYFAPILQYQCQEYCVLWKTFNSFQYHTPAIWRHSLLWALLFQTLPSPPLPPFQYMPFAFILFLSSISDHSTVFQERPLLKSQDKIFSTQTSSTSFPGSLILPLDKRPWEQGWNVI